MKLDTITKRFDAAHHQKSEAEAKLAKYRQEMFAEFTKNVEQGGLAQQTVVIPSGFMDLESNPEAYIKKYFPGWEIVLITDNVALIQEDPSFVKFTYVNSQTKRVFGRTVAEGPPMLDDARLKLENPDLWERVSQWPEPWWSLVRGAIESQRTLPWSDSALDAATDEYMRNRGIERVVKDPASLPNNDLVELEPYIHPGPLTVRLVSPRDAKPEELQDNL